MSEIVFYNRYTQVDEVEKVYGDKWLRWLYETKLGRGIARLAAIPFVSKAYGQLQDTSMTRKKVAPFIRDFSIQIEDYEGGSLGGEVENSYACFNEFFIRPFKSGKRSFPTSNQEMGAPAEARYHAWASISDDQTFPVKGKELSSSRLLQNDKWNEVFRGGPLMIARLCPVDYHRYHFPFKGKVVDHFPVRGNLWTVNPIVFPYRDEVFSENERYVTILENEDFGRVAYIEVGATMVGKIIQSHNLKDEYDSGDEKGYFLFGGSTVILLGEAGKWLPSEDILNNSKNKKETYVHLGDTIAKAL